MKIFGQILMFFAFLFLAVILVLPRFMPEFTLGTSDIQRFAKDPISVAFCMLWIAFLWSVRAAAKYLKWQIGKYDLAVISALAILLAGWLVFFRNQTFPIFLVILLPSIYFRSDSIRIMDQEKLTSR